MNDKFSQQFNRELAEDAFSSGEAKRICDMLVSAAFYESDWRWVQDKCLDFLNFNDPNIRGLAATCLGHVARIHHQLDKEKVISSLRKHLKDHAISGQIEDALDDIEIFCDDSL